MKEFNMKIEKNKEDLFIKQPDTSHPAEKEATIHDNVRVGYYSQDFAALDPSMIVREALLESSTGHTDQDVYRIAAQFMLT